MVLIEEEPDSGPRRYLERRRLVGEGLRRSQPLGAAETGKPLRLFLHHGDRTWDEEPRGGRIDRIARRAVTSHGDGSPGRIFVVRPFPSPEVAAGIHLLARRNRDVAVDLIHGDGDGLVGRVLNAGPTGAGVGHLLSFRVALEKECSAAGDLRHAAVLAVVPNYRSQDVPPGSQLRSDVQGFIAPVGQVAARGTPHDALSVHE